MAHETLMIYLDYAATTPVDPRVLGRMQQFMTQEGGFGNPSSLAHRYGQSAQEAIDVASQQVADSIGAKASDIVFTSGATEANNLAIKGIAEFHQRRGKHIITVKTEHKAVLDSCHYLQRQGFSVTYLTPQANGLIALDELARAICDETILISVMLVNNETGIIQDIKRITELAHQKGVYVHTDAAQAMGKLAIDVEDLGVDLLSLSAHKAYGPKGIGALYIRPKIRLAAQMHGGGQQNSLRAGTLPTQQIVGMGDALQLANAELVEEQQRITLLQEQFLDQLSVLDDIVINGKGVPHVPNITNISFAGIDNGALLVMLPELAIATGSACLSGSIEPSHVLQAMGVDNQLAQAAVRFSFGRFTTAAEIDTATAQIITAVKRLRLMSPDYRVNQ